MMQKTSPLSVSTPLASQQDRRIFVCSCEKTMHPDNGAIARGCGGAIEAANQLCRLELDRFRDALAVTPAITVGCTQEQPLFEEVAEEAGYAGSLAFANIREQAGWADEGDLASPKMAALLAAAAEPLPPVATVSMTSEGVTLVLGTDDTALDAARRLAEHLDITVLLDGAHDVIPPRQTAFPVLKGRARTASGHLGAFEIMIDDYALPAPSSRAKFEFGPSRDGARSTADLIIDLTGGTPLFSADSLRAGYLRADPRNPAAVERLIHEASQLVGTFDKPRYVDFDASICAHSRSKITGCTRCLDLCPTGAITSAGDSVAIDPLICAGCGQCASVCPTGAASYALPPVDAVASRVRTLLRAYREAGGTAPVLLFHDGDHGTPLIDALARFGRGLPANVLPMQLNEITQAGTELMTAAVTYGATSIQFLAKARPLHDLLSLQSTIAMTNRIFEALGYGSAVVGLVETDDPDVLRDTLEERRPEAPPSRRFGAFVPPAGKRPLLELAFRELHRLAPEPVDIIALPAGAPFGGLAVDTEACTLCLACVSACPADALTDHPDRPTLKFTESLCVQCGLCAATCPEDAIALLPQLDFEAWATPKRVVKEEEPHHCIECGKAFGTRSTIERVTAKLAGHWMFSGPEGEQRRRVLEMCEDCRVSVVVAESFDPHEAETRRVRTTDDYLREREQRKH